MATTRSSRFPLTALFLGAAAVSAATGTAPKPMDLPAKVIGHLDLPVAAGKQMVLEKQGDKHYLYVQHASDQGYTVVEVTQPEFPSFARQLESSAGSATGEAKPAAATAVIAEAPDPAAKTSIHSTPNVPEVVNLQDLSDPEHPATVRTFKSVLSFLPDGGRGVFYLTNDEGLWVLKLNRPAIQPAKKKTDCDDYAGLRRRNPGCPDSIPGSTRPGRPR